MPLKNILIVANKIANGIQATGKRNQNIHKNRQWNQFVFGVCLERNFSVYFNSVTMKEKRELKILRHWPLNQTSTDSYHKQVNHLQNFILIPMYRYSQCETVWVRLHSYLQCFGFASDPDSSVDPYPDPNSEYGSGSRRAKITHKSRKKLRNFKFKSAGCSLLKAEDFFCSLGILNGGLGIG